MGIWVHPYAYVVLHVQVEMSFCEENGAMAKSECCCKVMVEAPNPRDCILQPWHIYASVLAP
jgi:hypothetical protein